ncbi:hypothetical protein Y032_0107g3801 [Ancylostoma ceylanicum]|nr:hypothetical protein Y032_0107g3801 [Ancylostoma ceylanicum]
MIMDPSIGGRNRCTWSERLVPFQNHVVETIQGRSVGADIDDGEGTSEPKTEAPAPHSTKSTTFPFTLAIAIFAVSLIVLVIF